MLAAIALSASPAVAQDPNAIYAKAVEALYNLDFSTAEQTFNSLTHQDESNPDYWNGIASTMLMKILYDQQKFNTDSFTGNSIGTKSSKETVDPMDERKLRNTVAVAMQKAETRLKVNPNDIRALYARGVSSATLAAFEALARRDYPGALSKAKAARKDHARVLQLDPNFVDARLAIGTYDYGVGTLSKVWRFFLGLGISTNKEDGIRNLEMVAQKGTRASTDAKLFLIVVYQRESRFNDALQVIDDLLAKYPRNFQLELSKATIYLKMKNWDKAAEVYASVLAKLQAKRDGYDRLREELVHYEAAKNDVNRLKLDEAVTGFNKVVASSKSTVDEKADSYIWLGRIFDSRNDRKKAVEQYNAVLKLNCDKEYLDAAQGYLKKPFKG